MNPAEGGEPISISYQDLMNVRQKVEQEMTVLTDAINKLQAIQQHFLSSQDVSRQMEDVKEAEDILVPLCDGLMVRGKAVRPQTVLVDLGAHYFVEMTQEKCREYCKRRLDFLNTQLVSLQKAGQAKFSERQQILDILQRYEAQMKQNQAQPKQARSG